MATVGVDDDLTTGQAAVAHGAADDESAGGVDVDAGVGGKLHALALEHGRMTLSSISARSCSVEISSECCVETTTFSTLTGLSSM